MWLQESTVIKKKTKERWKRYKSKHILRGTRSSYSSRKETTAWRPGESDPSEEEGELNEVIAVIIEQTSSVTQHEGHEERSTTRLRNMNQADKYGTTELVNESNILSFL